MKKLILVAALIAAFVPLVSFAAYQSAGKSVDINATQPINENAYVAGGTVVVSGTINGDLLAAGGSVFVSGKVNQDIMAAGGNIMLSGVSAEDVRIAGGNLSIGANLTGELMAGGGQVTVTPDSTITKDSSIFGGAVVFNGDEAGNLEIAGGSVYIGGTVEKNLVIKGAKEITIGSTAVIKGNLDYTGPNDATIDSGAQILGTTTFHKVNTSAQTWSGPLALILTFGFIAKFFAILLTAYLLWYLFRNDMVGVLMGAGSRFGKELLHGFIFVVVIPAAIMISFVTVIGALAGGVVALIYAAFLVLGFPVTVLVTATLLKKRMTDLRWYDILVAAMLIQLLVLIPFLGWLAYIIVYLASLGAFVNVIRRKFMQ